VISPHRIEFPVFKDKPHKQQVEIKSHFIHFNMESLKNKLRKIIPRKLIYQYYLYTAKKASNYDLRRRVYDKVYDDSEAEKVKRDLTLAYHIIEKGLTMPAPRPGFGKKVVISLVNTVLRYQNLNLPLTEMEYRQSVSVLKEYVDLHEQLKVQLDQDVAGKLALLENQFKTVEGMRQIKISSDAYFKDAGKPFDLFCRSRYSVRNYIDKEIPLNVLYDCIDLAQKSPSFCNRQPTRVYIVKSAEKKKQVLELQNGNRGFGHLAETLLVVSSVISTTKDIHERNENHLNGGIFIMSLLNALHFYRIGACSLNWAVSNDKDIKTRWC
jgi:hypothetical protein